jgi:hypothetical protein
MKEEPSYVNEAPASHATTRAGLNDIIRGDHGRQLQTFNLTRFKKITVISQSDEPQKTSLHR